MERSTCVVCGKKRLHKYLRQLPNLDGSKAWVCNNLKFRHKSYLQVSNVNYHFDVCQMVFLKLQFENIKKHIENHLAAKKSQWYYDKIIQEENVTPELTFLLQLRNNLY